MTELQKLQNKLGAIFGKMWVEDYSNLDTSKENLQRIESDLAALITQAYESGNEEACREQRRILLAQYTQKDGGWARAIQEKEYQLGYAAALKIIAKAPRG